MLASLSTSMELSLRETPSTSSVFISSTVTADIANSSTLRFDHIYIRWLLLATTYNIYALLLLCIMRLLISLRLFLFLSSYMCGERLKSTSLVYIDWSIDNDRHTHFSSTCCFELSIYKRFQSKVWVPPIKHHDNTVIVMPIKYSYVQNVASTCHVCFLIYIVLYVHEYMILHWYS